MKHKLTRTIALMLAVVMSFSMLLVPVQAASFTDVPENAWYAAAVDYVSEKGWMTGVGEMTFAPTMDVTRAMFVTLLAAYDGADVENDAVAFEDTAAGKWYTGSAAWAADLGIVSGIGGGRFAPNRAITRQDLCTMLYKYLNVVEIKLKADADRTYADFDKVASYAKEAVGFCAASGLVTGFEDSTFRPRATATRAQVAQILMRLDLLRKGQELPEDPMPAQSFEGEAGEDMTVSVNAPEGALPENTEMTVRRVTDEATLAAYAESIKGQVYAAADISFSKDDEELEPEKMVEVQISLDGLQDIKTPIVYHVNADGTMDQLSSERISVVRGGNAEALRFYAKDFSVYIIGSGANDAKLLTVKFYDGNNNLINVQAVNLKRMGKYIQDGKALIHDPGVPTITPTQSFEGWQTTDYPAGEKNTNLDVDAINAYIEDHYDANSANATLEYHAMVYDVRYVVYHDQAGAVLMTQAFHVTESGGTVQPADVKIDWSYVGFKGEQNFAGWVAENYIDVMGDYPLYNDTLNTHYIGEDGGNVYKNGTTYELSDNLQLYPYLNTGHWLVFDTYKDQDADDTSTSYIGPAFYEEGTNTVAPAVPTRTGYEFKGWYKEKQFTNRFIFGSPISEDTTIYAKWAPKETTYQVVFWQQNPTDAVDAADSAKTYSFYKSDVRTATTGQSVSINTASSGTTADNRLGGNDASNIGEMGFYFSYNGTNSDTASAVVKGDGSTVLNVYYDRKVITYNFYGDLTNGYSTFNSGNYYSSYYPHYGRSGSSGNYSYFRIYTNASTYNDGDYNNPTWYTNAACTTRYTGTVYHLTFDTETLSNNSADVQFGSIQGLYGSTMDYFDWSSASTTISGNDWPYSGEYLMWHDATTGRYLNKMFQYTTGEATTSTTIDYYLNQYQVSSTTRPYTCLGQDTDGSFTITLDEASLKSTETLYFAGDEYFGYELDRYNKTANNYNSATQWNGGQVSCSYSDIGSNGHAYFYYARNKWNFVYESNNSQVKTESVYWEKSLSDLAGYVPTNGPEGCYFDGWYADPGFDTPFNFSQEMPNHSVMIYAKWTQMRFRVVLDPTGGEQGVNASDITFPGNQATTFRVNYGELVEGSSINNAQRTGYTLLGWYLDKNHTIPYNFSNPVTTSTQNVDMSYATASDAERQGSDPWNSENPTYTDVGRSNVRGKLTIYAHWRQDPDGVVGINVKYLATDKNNNTGTFSTEGNPTIWNDPKIYADQAMAFGQPASTPDNTGLQFLYWEILDRDGNPVDKAYPGQLWRVNYSYAVEEAVSGAGSNAASPVALSTETPKLSRPGEIVHPTAETMTVYAPVDTIETGTDYLIGVTASNGTTYLLMSYNPSTGTYYGSASMSGYTTNRLSYAIPAVLDENGYVTGVDASNISGATLAHVEWIFNSTSNGKYSIQSGYNSSYYLRVGDDSSTTNLNLYPASYSSGYGATWVWDSSTHRLSHYYSSSYNRLYLSMLSVGGVPTYFDVDNDTDYARTVQLYKKTTIEVGPTMHTVTFMDGYTNTKIADVQVEDGTAAAAPDAPDHSAQGMIFNGWDTPFDNVTEDTTVTALYVDQSSLSYTVTFRYMNSDGEWVTSEQTVQHGRDATAPTLPTPPTGYTFNSWDKKLTNITSNLTINAVYKQVATKKYVVTLRAVYGLKTTEAKTHIYWYANNGTEDNNGAGVRQEMEPIEINEAQAIPTPTNFTYEVASRDGETTTVTGLKYDDHVFLGWARLDNTNGTSQTAHPELLASDLWLIWHEDASVSGGGYYTVNTANDPDFVAEGGNASQHVAYVAADEMTPYHDMYAVWSGFYYVFHSATGKIEAIEVERTKSGNTVTVSTDNLVEKVTSGYLYGGYYTTYGGAKDITTEAMRGYKDSALSKRNDTDKMVSTSAVTYDGSTVKNGDTRFWTKANAYGYGNQASAPAGDNLVPTAGTVYYLKEVPEQYLTTKYIYTYDTLNGNVINNFFMLTVVDDGYYKQIGFLIKAGADNVEDAATGTFKQRKTLSSYFTISETNHPESDITVNAASFGLTSGYIGSLQDDASITGGSSFSLMPKWTTLDGVGVNSRGGLQLTVNSDKTAITYKALTGSTVSTPLTTFYVQLDNSTFKNEYLKINDERDDFVATWLYFFNGSNYLWVKTTAVEGTDNSLWKADFPSGEWQAVIVVRGNPDKEPGFGEGISWNQTANLNPTGGNFTNRSGFNLVTLSGWDNGYGQLISSTGLYGATP